MLTELGTLAVNERSLAISPNVVLVSTYDLGHQPFGLASPAAWLRRAGYSVTCLDLAVSGFDSDLLSTADVIGFYLPMHTATRIAINAIRRTRELNRRAHICAFGLYAPMNADHLRRCGAD